MSKKPIPAAPKIASSPFAGLAALRDALPEGSTPPPTSAPTPDAKTKGPAKAVLRFERKGRGGKEVTLVEQLGLDADALATLARTLKQSLGVGGAVEGDAILLSGDVRERVRPLLTKHGVRTIVG